MFLFSIFTISSGSYVFPIFLKGAKKNGLDIEDIHQCPVDDEAEKLLAKITK